MKEPLLRLLPKRRLLTHPLLIGAALLLIGVAVVVGLVKHRKHRAGKSLPGEVEPNDVFTAAQGTRLPLRIEGSLDRPGDVDHFRFHTAAGQPIGVRLELPEGARLAGVLTLFDAAGNVVGESTRGALGYTCDRAGDYVLSVRDLEYRGEAGWTYKLEAGSVPVITAVFPLGLQRGTERAVEISGVHLGEVRSVTVQAPADAKPGTALAVTLPGLATAPAGEATVVVGEFPEVHHPARKAEPATAALAELPELPVPGTGNGRIDQPGATDVWRFKARKGERLVLEVEARRLGSPLDSYIEILDAKFQPIARATLRCLAKTITDGVTGRASSEPDLKIENWDDLTVGDFVFVESELVRVRDLPKKINPPVKLGVVTVNKQRRGYLDTTPTHRGLNVPVYKVSVHPPGTEFPPNGLPVFTLPWYNDDGCPKYGKDSRLFFDPPADGAYLVRIGDTRGEAGSAYAYRLTVRPPRPGFKLTVKPPEAVKVHRGGAAAVQIMAERIDGFDGPIDVCLDNLPPGFSAPSARIVAEEDTAIVSLFAEPSAQAPAKDARIKAVARAEVAGHKVTRESPGVRVRLQEPGDVETRTDQSELTLPAGGQVSFTVTVERRNGLTGNVPLEVRGLPAGVWIQGFAMNRIVVLEGQSSRTLVLCAELNLAPIAQPITVLARDPKKKTEHAAPSVWLKVVAPGGP